MRNMHWSDDASYTSETRKYVLTNFRERRLMKHFGKGAGCLPFTVVTCKHILSKQFVALYKQLLVWQYFMIGNCKDNLHVSFNRIKERSWVYAPIHQLQPIHPPPSQKKGKTQLNIKKNKAKSHSEANGYSCSHLKSINFTHTVNITVTEVRLRDMIL